jgi:hypothetical protein
MKICRTLVSYGYVSQLINQTVLPATLQIPDPSCNMRASPIVIPEIAGVIIRDSQTLLWTPYPVQGDGKNIGIHDPNRG